MNETIEISEDEKRVFLETIAKIEVESNIEDNFVKIKHVQRAMNIDLPRFEKIVSEFIDSGDISRKDDRIYSFSWKSAIKSEERERFLQSLKKVEKDESVFHVTLEILMEELGMSKLNFYRICRVLQQHDIIQVDQLKSEGANIYVIKSKIEDFEDESSRMSFWLLLTLGFVILLSPALVLLVEPIRNAILGFPLVVVFSVGYFVNQAFNEQLLLLQMESALRAGYIKDRGQEQSGDRNGFEDGLISTKSIPLALNQLVVKSKPLIYTDGIHQSVESTRSSIYRLYWWGVGAIRPKIRAGIFLFILMILNVLTYVVLAPKLSDVLEVGSLSIFLKYLALSSSLFVLWYYKDERRKKMISVNMLVYTPTPSKRLEETFELWSAKGKLAKPLNRNDVKNVNLKPERNVYVRIRGSLNANENLHRKNIRYDYYQK